MMDRNHHDRRASPACTPKSLNQLILENPRDRLHVKPSRWTARHLEVLGCTFVDRTVEHPLPILSQVDIKKQQLERESDPHQSLLSPPPEDDGAGADRKDVDTPPPVDEKEWIDARLLEHAKNLPVDIQGERGTTFIYRLVGGHRDDLVASHESIPFFFNRRNAELVGYMFLRNRDTGFLVPGPVRLAYIEPLYIRHIRYGYKEHRFPPTKNPLDDPYMVAILIAMAQHKRQLHYDAHGSKAKDATWSVKLLLLLPRDQVSEPPASHIYLVSTTVSSGFLDRFDRPGKIPTTECGLTVVRSRIPLLPPEELVKFLGALGNEVCAEQPVDCLELVAKRKREVFESPTQDDGRRLKKVAV